MLRLAQSIDALAKTRPVFHSEADFQHALAMQLAHDHSGLGVRLEYRPLPGRSIYTDIWMTLDGWHYAVELKYKTRGAVVEVAGERFDLANHGAQDIGKHDFWKDVQRVEEVCAARPCTQGAAVFLTNDQTYWRESGREGTCAEAFHMHEGRVATGQLSWAEHTGAGTKRNREDGVALCSSYRVCWHDFGIGLGGPLPFKYALVEIGAQTVAGV